MRLLRLLVFSAWFFGVQGQLEEFSDSLLSSGIPECEDWAASFIPLERETCYGGEVCLYPEEVCATTESDDIPELQETGELPGSAMCEPVPQECQKYLEGEDVPPDMPDPTNPPPRLAEPLRQSNPLPQPHSLGNGMGTGPGPAVGAVEVWRFGPQQPQQRQNFGQQQPQQRQNFGPQQLQQRQNFGPQQPQQRQNFGQQQQPAGRVNCGDSPQYANKCPGWRHTCETNPYFMKVQCQRTCNTCGVTVGNVNPKPPRPGCVDIHKLCGFWANERGECWKNPNWMGTNCRLSCNIC